MISSVEHLAHLREVSRAMLSDPFFLDAVEQLVWRIQDTEDTLSQDERRDYIVALVLKMRTQLSQSLIERNAVLTEQEIGEIEDAVLVAALDIANASPVSLLN